MACLWQARPTLTQEILRQVIEESASQYTHPDYLLGYGIPNYATALTISKVGIQSETSIQAYPNPFKDAFTLSFDTSMSGNFEISLISVTGDLILRTNRISLREEGVP